MNTEHNIKFKNRISGFSELNAAPDRKISICSTKHILVLRFKPYTFIIYKLMSFAFVEEFSV